MPADSSSADQRRSPRSKTYAKVLVEATHELGYLRDLSREGCQIALLAAPREGPRESMTVTVLPETQIGLPPFRMAVEVMWIRPSPPYFLLGGTAGAVGGSDGQEALEQLYRYYSG